jgi:hypothetical protein
MCMQQTVNHRFFNPLFYVPDDANLSEYVKSTISCASVPDFPQPQGSLKRIVAGLFFY